MKPKLEDEAMELMRVGTGVRSKDMRREWNRISVQTNQVWLRLARHVRHVRRREREMNLRKDGD